MADKPPSPPSYDQDLLARLNALRKSNITLQHTGPALSIPRTRPTPDTDLSARLRALRDDSDNKKLSKASPPRHIVASPSTPISTVHPSAPDTATSFLTDSNEQTSSVISQLQSPAFDVNDEANRQLTRDAIDFAGSGSRAAAPITTLRRPSQAGFGVPTLEHTVRRLRDEAVDGLAVSEELFRSDTENKGTARLKRREAESGSENERSSNDEIDEDEDEDRDADEEAREADEMLARLLDEAELEKSEEGKGDDETNAEDRGRKSPKPNTTPDKPRSMPDAPSELPEPPEAADPDTLAFAASIAARMAALNSPTHTPETDSLGLPSAPTTLPSSAPYKPSPPPKPEPSYSCVICYDDATVLCQGCEDNFGDVEDALYCARCWKEGHLGPDAGPEERRHEWIGFKRPK